MAGRQPISTPEISEQRPPREPVRPPIAAEANPSKEKVDKPSKAEKPPKDPKPPKELKPSKEPKPPKEPKPSKEPKPPKEPKPSKEPKSTKEPEFSEKKKDPKSEKPKKDPKLPNPPIAPPGKIMSMLLVPVPFARGGCCGETLPFYMSCIIMAVAGIVLSLANLFLILAYVLTYSTKVWAPKPGGSETCVNAWWDRDVPFYYFCNLPLILLTLHVLLLIMFIVSCVLLIISSTVGNGTLLRINSLLGCGLLFPSFFVGLAEVLTMSPPAWLHWNMLILAAFTITFLYSIMIVNGYDKRLQNPIKEDAEEEDVI